MLKGIPSILSPDLLKLLSEMGHTDELTIGDANFPGHTYGQNVIRMDGVGIVELLNAILQVFPLDTYEDTPCILMEVVKGDMVKTPIWEQYKEIVKKHDKRGEKCFSYINKWKFYQRAREHSYAVIMTSETALYGNIILKKGVILPEEFQ